ncbi:MAG TPA: hypothetical protein VFD13_02835, partial [Candidatus Kapabacteria bacterium]|nr:hypothetical protein [Candidatus Kapabacteria bacterium]
MNLKLKYLITGLSCCMALASCGNKAGIKHSLRMGRGGKMLGGTFHVNETADIRSLDPVQMNDQTSVQVGENVYDRLLEFDENLILVPG